MAARQSTRRQKQSGGHSIVSEEVNKRNAESEVGARALGVLDLLGTDEVGPDFLPSSFYPSDHIAIAADLEIIGFMKRSLSLSAQPKSAETTDGASDHSELWFDEHEPNLGSLLARHFPTFASVYL